MQTSKSARWNYRCHRFEGLVNEYPCLWDPQDFNYTDKRLRAACREELLVKYNSQSRIAITMAQMKKRLESLRWRLNMQRKANTHETSGNQAAMPTGANASPSSRPDSGQCSDRFEELVAEYPCLWDDQDYNYLDQSLKAHCREKLLDKYNHWASIEITMDQLKRKLNTFRTRLNRQRKKDTHGTSDNQAAMPTSTSPTLITSLDTGTPTNRIEQLMAQYRYLWDPQDLNYTDRRRMKKDVRLYELLDKFNSLSSIPVSLRQIKKKINYMKERLRRERKAENLHAAALRAPSGEDSQGSGLSELGTSSSCGTSINPASDRHRVASGTPDPAAVRQASTQRNLVTAPPQQCRDSTEPVNEIQRVIQENPNRQTVLLPVVFHCGMCGEVQCEILNSEDKPYIVNNKIAFTMNDLSIELNFDKDTTVCPNCDTKLKEMYDFLKLVKHAQDRINSMNIVKREDEMTIDDDDEMKDDDDNYADDHDEMTKENEDHQFIIDSLKVTDTEVIKPTVQKRKCEEFSNMKKKFRVTIDLNSRNNNIDNDRNTIDDIEVEYEMLKKADVLCTKSKADEVSKVIVTEDSEDIIREDDVNKEFSEMGEIVADDIRKNDLACEHKCDNENEESEGIIYDIKKEIVTEDTYKDIDERGNNENSEDIILDVKKEIDTDDLYKELDNSVENKDSKDIIIDVKKEIVTDDVQKDGDG